METSKYNEIKNKLDSGSIKWFELDSKIYADYLNYNKKSTSTKQSTNLVNTQQSTKGDIMKNETINNEHKDVKGAFKQSQKFIYTTLRQRRFRNLTIIASILLLTGIGVGLYFLYGASLPAFIALISIVVATILLGLGYFLVKKSSFKHFVKSK